MGGWDGSNSQSIGSRGNHSDRRVLIGLYDEFNRFRANRLDWI